VEFLSITKRTKPAASLYLFCALLIGGAGDLAAQADYFQGKLFDWSSVRAPAAAMTLARLLATHYGKYIPGNPSIVVKHAGRGLAGSRQSCLQRG
jgi:hypothetical protein